MPNTLHYVVTVEDSIAFGRHTLSASSSQRVAMGVVHTFVLGYAITNVLHDDLNRMLRCIMAMWYTRYNGDSSLRTKLQHHVPDMADPQGLLDVMAIGNILECAQVLDRRSYQKPGVPQAEKSEMAMARRRYRKLAIVFALRYSTVVGGRKTHPLSIFRRSLVEFAAAIVVYKREQEGQSPPTSRNVYQRMLAMFETNYPELIPCWETMISKGLGSLVWTGPPITIQPNHTGKLTRQAARERNQETPDLNFTDLTMYHEATIVTPPQSPRPVKRRRGGESIYSALFSSSLIGWASVGDGGRRPARNKARRS